jgi:hypothetical protein
MVGILLSRCQSCGGEVFWSVICDIWLHSEPDPVAPCFGYANPIRDNPPAFSATEITALRRMGSGGTV